MNAVARTDGIPKLMVRLWGHLNLRRRRQFLLLLVLMLISALAEMASLGAVLPFLGILTSPEWVLEQEALMRVFQSFGWRSAQDLIFPLTAMFAVAAVFAGVVRMALLWASTRLAFAAGADLSMAVYQRTLYQPYEVHVGRNSSEIISGITNKVGGAVNVLYNFLTLTSSTIMLMAITVTILAIDPAVALVASLGFGACYGVVALSTRGMLRRNGERIATEQTEVIKALQEGLGAIRDVLLDGAQPVFCEVYRRADLALRRAQGDNLFVGGCPRYAMEAMGMVLIAGLAYGMSRQAGGMTAALPVLGALALGAQRLIPALQQGYSAWASMAGNHQALADTIDLLDQPLDAVDAADVHAPMALRESIRFANVKFKYQAGKAWVLNGVDLGIAKGSRVGFIGVTGSGKSTALDILMGLLNPTEGALLVDGRPLAPASVKSWQRSIAHVPQSIYLTDATIAENIAFGVPRSGIDMDRVRQAARKAQIADFIEAHEGGYDMRVGERGARLSGGQRQRIGIARALYKQASVLVFDEATSALDNATEQSVMEAIGGLDRDLTIIIIAHRLSTLRHCDVVVRLVNGRIVEKGTYQDICAMENGAGVLPAIGE